MLRTLILGLTLALTLIFLGGNAASAHEGVIEPYEDVEESALAPDSPFYFLRSWQEAIEGFIANFQGDEARADLELRFAERRIAEMKRLARLGGNEERMEKLRERWQKHLEQAQEKAGRMKEKREEMQKRVLEQMDRHRVVLEKILEQVPDKAKDAIDRAIENYSTNREKLLKEFTTERRQTIEEHLKEHFDQTIDQFRLNRSRFRDLLKSGTEETTE